MSQMRQWLETFAKGIPGVIFNASWYESFEIQIQTTFEQATRFSDFATSFLDIESLKRRIGTRIQIFETVAPAFATAIQNFATAMRNLTRFISNHLDVRALRVEAAGLSEAGTPDDQRQGAGG